MRNIAFFWIFLLCSSLGANAFGKVSGELMEKIAHEERIPVKLLKSVAWVERGVFD